MGHELLTLYFAGCWQCKAILLIKVNNVEPEESWEPVYS